MLIDIFSTPKKNFSTEYTGWFNELLEHYGDPHPKRQLRIDAFNDLVEGDSFTGNIGDRVFMRKCRVKVKTDENAKFLKFIRLIGDLGVGASLQGFRLTKFLKAAMSKEDFFHDFPEGRARFIFCASPRISELTRIFRLSQDMEEKYLFVVFSDDALYIRKDAEGEPQAFNVDIKTCDLSHTDEMFQFMKHATPEQWHDDVQILIEQLSRPVTIANPDNKREKVTLKVKGGGAHLYSGSTLTTYINNIGSFVHGSSICMNDAKSVKEIQDATERAGYQVTVEECESIEDIQFLKHSPAITTRGEIVATFNCGAFLRAFGVCKNELPGRGPYKHRANLFNLSLLNGMFPRLIVPFIEKLKTKFTKNLEGNELSTKTQDAIQQYMHTTTDLEYKTINELDDHNVHLTNEQYLARYRLTISEIHKFTEDLERCDLGWQLDNHATRTILSRDY